MTKTQILTLIQDTATLWKVDPKLIAAIVTVESDFNPAAIAGEGTPDERRGGAYGLMQMTLKTAQGLGWRGTDPAGLLDPGINLFWGCMLVHQLGKRKGYTVEDIICAYNSGRPKAHAPETTLTYLGRVLDALKVAQHAG
jgi:soluble lytic murein transglycosylase-like protein